MNKKVIISVVLSVLILFTVFNINIITVSADSLESNIEEQLANIDLSELEDFFNNVKNEQSENLLDLLNNILEGNYTLDVNDVFSNILKIFLTKTTELVPMFLGVIAISIFCGLMQGFKSSFVSEGVSDIIFFICFLAIVLIMSTAILDMYENAKITMKNIAKLTQIMSPIILTLMIASGGAVSASVYKPAVIFLSSGVTSIFLSIVIPLIGLMFVFCIVSNFSSEIKLNKYIDFASSTIKWIIGIVVAIFGLFISIQGLTSAFHDGVTLRVAKYTLSNSIPIVGGLVKDGFDLILLSSVLIKNAIGISSVFILFSIVLSPIVFMMVFSLLLKFTAAVTEGVADCRISNFCTSLSKCITYLCASVILIGLMLFVTILLMILSANSIL